MNWVVGVEDRWVFLQSAASKDQVEEFLLRAALPLFFEEFFMKVDF